MKIKLESSVYIQGQGSFPLGSVADVDNKVANELIKVGRAVKFEQEEETEKPKATKKKVKKEVDK